MSSCPPSPGTGSYPDVLLEDRCYEDKGSAATGSYPDVLLEDKCHEDKGLAAILHLKYGPQRDEPWTDKEIAKDKFRAKVQALPAQLASHLALRKVHLADNGYGLKLFFEAVPQGIRGEVVKMFQPWAGEGGEVRFLSEDEVNHQAKIDANHRNQMRRESAPLEDVTGVASLMTMCIALQGEPEKEGPTRDMQLMTSSLAVKCFSRAQAAKVGSVSKRRRLSEDLD